MKIIKNKTKKKIGKQLRKLVKQHGAEVALGAATALVTAVINKATGEDGGKGGRKEKKAGGRKRKKGGEGDGKKGAKGSTGKKSEKDKKADSDDAPAAG